MFGGSRLPHALRIVIFFLRVTLGLHFLYLGFSTLFRAMPLAQIDDRALRGLYAWLLVPAGTGTFPLLFQIACLAIGICLLLGLFTRTAAIAGIAVILGSYFSHFTLNAFQITDLLRDEALFAMALLVLVFADAGKYLGVDSFIRVHLISPHKR